MIFNEMYAMDAKRTAKATVHVQSRLSDHQCIACTGLPEKAVRRGLCSKCYQRWRHKRQSLGSAKLRLEFDVALIKQGKLLPTQEVRDFTHERNVFDEVAAEVKS